MVYPTDKSPTAKKTLAVAAPALLEDTSGVNIVSPSSKATALSACGKKSNTKFSDLCL